MERLFNNDEWPSIDPDWQYNISIDNNTTCTITEKEVVITTPFICKITFTDDDEEEGGKDMLYLVSAVETQVDPEAGKVITDTLGPDLILASGDNDAKIKALVRWGIMEESLDRVQVYVLPFRPV